MQNRRSFIKILTALGLAAPFAPRAVAAPVAATEFFIVDGWVLTGADLAALRIDPALPAV